jgi:hypothetical protein
VTDTTKDKKFAEMSAVLEKISDALIKGESKEVLMQLIDESMDLLDALVEDESLHPEIVERISVGIEEAKAGKTIDRGDFSQYLEED